MSVMYSRVGAHGPAGQLQQHSSKATEGKFGLIFLSAWLLIVQEGSNSTAVARACLAPVAQAARVRGPL